MMDRARSLIEELNSSAPHGVANAAISPAYLKRLRLADPPPALPGGSGERDAKRPRAQEEIGLDIRVPVVQSGADGGRRLAMARKAYVWECAMRLCPCRPADAATIAVFVALLARGESGVDAALEQVSLQECICADPLDVVVDFASAFAKNHLHSRVGARELGHLAMRDFAKFQMERADLRLGIRGELAAALDKIDFLQERMDEVSHALARARSQATKFKNAASSAQSEFQAYVSKRPMTLGWVAACFAVFFSMGFLAKAFFLR